MRSALALRNLVGTPIAIDLTGTTITTGAYVQLSAALGAGASAILASNTSAKAIKLAVGGAGSEKDVPVWIAPGAQSVLIPVELAKGARLSAKSLTADATTGFLVINFLG